MVSGKISPTVSAINYRPDIDGLRAIAVGLVILYHFFPQIVPGGFIGVDVFFVISGYLITRIIATQVSQNKFSLLDFYAHRIRRIFPALLVVLLAVYSLGWLFLHDTEFRKLSKHIFASSLFLNNFLLRNEKGYFDSASETKPLLHFWSLSIEEQFYLLWPLVLWGILRYLHKPKLSISLICMASFIANLYWVERDMITAFYMPFSRAWELLAGGWLALQSRAHGKTSFAVANATLGLACLVLMGFIFDAHIKYPGYWAAGVTLSTMAVIFSPTPWSQLLLCNKLSIALGQISYPLYLWHWPLLSIATIMLPAGVPTEIKLTLLIASIVLAWLTKNWVEDPLRFRVPAAKAIPLLILGMLIMSGVSVLTYLQNGISTRDIHVRNTGLGTGHQGIQTPAYVACNNFHITNECKTEPNKVPRYVLMGDSKAASLLPGLIRTNGSPDGWLFIGGNASDGAPIPLISDDPKLQKFSRNYTETLQQVDRMPEVKWLVFAVATRGLFQLKREDTLAELENYPNYEEVLARFSKGIALALTLNKPVMIVIDNPTFPAPEKCASRNIGFKFWDDYVESHRPVCEMTLQEYEQQTYMYRRLIADTMKMYSDRRIEVYDTIPDLCDASKNVCGMYKAGRFLYGMTDHISEHAADLIGAKINQRLQR